MTMMLKLVFIADYAEIKKIEYRKKVEKKRENVVFWFPHCFFVGFFCLFLSSYRKSSCKSPGKGAFGQTLSGSFCL